MRDVGAPAEAGRGTTLTGRGGTLTGPGEGAAGATAGCAASEVVVAPGSLSSPIENLAVQAAPRLDSNPKRRYSRTIS
jgi:hypothetical protein